MKNYTVIKHKSMSNAYCLLANTPTGHWTWMYTHTLIITFTLGGSTTENFFICCKKEQNYVHMTSFT